MQGVWWGWGAGEATIETIGPRMRKTLVHKGGFGSLSNTWCLLSDANRKHGPCLPFGQCWLVRLSPWLSSALCFDVARSKVFSLLRELLLQGSTHLDCSSLAPMQAWGHLLPFCSSPVYSGQPGCLASLSGPWMGQGPPGDSPLDLGCVPAVRCLEPDLWGLPCSAT